MRWEKTKVQIQASHRGQVISTTYSLVDIVALTFHVSHVSHQYGNELGLIQCIYGKWTYYRFIFSFFKNCQVEIKLCVVVFFSAYATQFKASKSQYLPLGSWDKDEEKVQVEENIALRGGPEAPKWYWFRKAPCLHSGENGEIAPQSLDAKGA